jgi:hypothetical protein
MGAPVVVAVKRRGPALSELVGLLAAISGAAGFLYFYRYFDPWPGQGGPVQDQQRGLIVSAVATVVGLAIALVPVPTTGGPSRHRRVLRIASLAVLGAVCLSAGYEVWSNTGYRPIRRRQQAFVAEACPDLQWEGGRADAVLTECYARADRRNAASQPESLQNSETPTLYR